MYFFIYSIDLSSIVQQNSFHQKNRNVPCLNVNADLNGIYLYIYIIKKPRHLVPTWQDLEVLDATNKAIKPLQDLLKCCSENLM